MASWRREIEENSDELQRLREACSDGKRELQERADEVRQREVGVARGWTGVLDSSPRLCITFALYTPMYPLGVSEISVFLLSR